ncbi:MAG: ABC transporter permease subunit [Chitinivibrionales bacterium]|nr:ABC transporter permease subunit [Chitinivibrionales bacterium]
MQNVLTIFKKEFKAYFLSPVAYVYITIYLAVTNFLFFQGFFIMNQADVRSYFGLLPWIFLLFIPAITMRIWAEEKKVKTLELLLTWPLRDVEVVVGKFLASFAFLCVAILLSITVPITVAILGDPDPGPIIGGYIGAVLMGAAYLSIGLWISSLTENQIVAFIFAMAITFGMFFIGNQFVLMNLPFKHQLAPILSYVSLGNHYESIMRGVLDSRDIIYYLSVIGFFLFLNVRSLESRKWE